MCERNRCRHELGGFVAGKTKHQALIPGPLLGSAFAFGRRLIHTLLDIARLLGHFANHPAGIGVKNAIAVYISNAANCVPNPLFEIKLRITRNLPGENNEIAFGERLASDSAQRVRVETGVKNVIADGIANFVRVTFSDRFGGKNVTMRHGKIEI